MKIKLYRKENKILNIKNKYSSIKERFVFKNKKIK